ncbi:uncharacterized protein LOC124257546 [Haliotis rubra]|uniref:uncharacterized protein LOC124257546 n=1 Tax=Haliotis rubra TaxID=36100 RepID=UPI001EE523A8|nr:uncharacterized protein LOC124257546 [Haliotis rubra]
MKLVLVLTMPKKTPQVVPPETVAKPNLQWEVGAYSLEDILQKYPLPRVVQCAYTLNDDISTEQSNFDFLQPLLLYQKRVCNKVTATSLNTDPQTGNTVEVGDPLLIPEDYKGWFAVKLTSFEKPIPHYRKVANLASSDCDMFLIGGEHEVQAVQIQRTDGSPQPRVLYPGDVLRMGHLYVATSKVKKSIFSKSVTLEKKFVLCLDQADREVMLPLDAAGVFYIVKYKNTHKQSIMQIKDIIDTQPLPCKVKLVYGRVPLTPCIFTGVLNLNEFHLDTSAIVSSVFNLRNILLEIPTSIPLMFRVAKPDSSLINSRGYTNAFGLCQENAERYMRNIKVAQSLPTEENRNQSTPPVCRNKQIGETSAVPKSDAVIVDSKGSETTHKCSPPTEVKPLSKVLPKPQKPTGSMPDILASHNVTPAVLPRTPLNPTTPHPAKLRQHEERNLDAAVGFSPAPKLVVRSTPAPRKPAPPPPSNKPKPATYESVWIEPKSTTPPSTPPFTSPSTPPKCGSGYVHPKRPQKVQTRKTIRISTTNGYLTVPVYLDNDDSDSDEVMNLADKINLWQRENKSDQSTSSAGQLDTCVDGLKAGRAGSFTYSETGGPANRGEAATIPPRAEHVMVYENIQSLRKLKLGSSGSDEEALASPSKYSEHLVDGIKIELENPDRPEIGTDEDRSINKWKKNQIPVPPLKPKKQKDVSYSREVHQVKTEDVIYESPDERKHVSCSRPSKFRIHQRNDVYEPVEQMWQKKGETGFQPLRSSTDDVVYESPDDIFLEPADSPSPTVVTEDVMYEAPDNIRQGKCISLCADSGISIMDEGADKDSTAVAMSATEVHDKLKQAGGVKQKNTGSPVRQ